MEKTKVMVSGSSEDDPVQNDRHLAQCVAVKWE